MGNQIFRNVVVVIGTLILAYFALRFLGVFGHSAANVAGSAADAIPH